MTTRRWTSLRTLRWPTWRSEDLRDLDVPDAGIMAIFFYLQDFDLLMENMMSVE